MEIYKEKKVFFEGRGDQLDKEELIKYLSQHGASFTKEINVADIIIDTHLPYLEDKIYLKSRDGIDVIELESLEKEFSENIDIDSVLMAIKISHEQDRLIKLIDNNYFSDTIFLVFLQFYDWKGEGIHDTDENRDVSTAIAGRFCTMQELNHNVKHSPTAIYYTALETTNPKLLEILYHMPEYKINDKNALLNQPLSTHEVVAINPNISKPLMMQIFKNKKMNELLFLASNPSLGELVKKELMKLNNNGIIKILIESNNLPKGEYKNILNTKYKNMLLKNIGLEDSIFATLIKSNFEIESLIELSKNGSLQSYQIDILLEFNNEDININLLKSNQLDRKHIQTYLKKNNKFYNISLGHNEILCEKSFLHLYSLNDLDVNISLSFNPKTPVELLKKLYDLNENYINMGLASNPSSPINILMQLQLDNRYSTVIAKNETYKEYSRNALGIGNDYSLRFKRDTYEYI